MSDAQRALWIDLLALAGRSRFPGRICAGEVGGAFVGYPLNKFQALMAEPIDVQQTLELFEKTGKIKLTVTSEIPTKLVMIELLNWDRYQSEYQRQKKYRRKELQQSDSRSYNQSDKTEGEVEGEVEKKHRAPSAPSVPAIPAQVQLHQETRDAAFEVFWEEWPRKQAKGSARKAWQKIPISEYPAIMAGLEKWKKSEQWQRNVIPNPATWLNGKRWEDQDIPQARIGAEIVAHEREQGPAPNFLPEKPFQKRDWSVEELCQKKK